MAPSIRGGRTIRETGHKKRKRKVRGRNKGEEERSIKEAKHDICTSASKNFHPSSQRGGNKGHVNRDSTPSLSANSGISYKSVTFPGPNINQIKTPDINPSSPLDRSFLSIQEP